MTPQEIAERSAEAMWASDDASKWLGMSLDHVAPGEARLSMTVEAHHTNGQDLCHGGFIFTLADSAFAFACNSYNRLAVAQHNSITYLRPGKIGDVLVARATEQTLAGRTGVYDVTVHAGDKLIATFRGVSRVVDGEHFVEGAN